MLLYLTNNNNNVRSVNPLLWGSETPKTAELKKLLVEKFSDCSLQRKANNENRINEHSFAK